MDSTTERLDERLARLERERQEADKQYNDALTAVDQSLVPPSELPPPPARYDASKLADVNHAWDILSGQAPAIDRSFKGRLRGFIWRLIGPPLDAQRRFNAVIVDHLNRNVAAHESAERATAAALAAASEESDQLRRFQTHLLQYLQTVTLYVDTRDRSTGGRADVLNSAISSLTGDWMKRWESLSAREHRADARMNTLAAALDDVRATASLAQQTALSLKRDVETSLSREPGGAVAPPPSTDLNAFKYLGFEEAFRGSADDISTRLAEYAPAFDGLSDILDVGCGRGEFLSLLGSRGIRARGIDTNDAMVAECQARGLNVVKADALAHLREIPDESIGGLFASQVVEHLPPDYLAALLETAGHKVRPGGVLILETINPTCWLAFFESYIRDLTHIRALHPETLQYFVRVSGFADVRIEFKSPVADVVRLEPLSRPVDSAREDFVEFVETFNDNVAKLNSRMFSYQDYAVIAKRVAASS